MVGYITKSGNIPKSGKFMPYGHQRKNLLLDNCHSQTLKTNVTNRVSGPQLMRDLSEKEAFCLGCLPHTVHSVGAREGCRSSGHFYSQKKGLMENPGGNNNFFENYRGCMSSIAFNPSIKKRDKSCTQALK